MTLKEQDKIEKDLIANQTAEQKGIKESRAAKKDVDDITKSYIESYPQLIQYIDEETGRLKLNSAELKTKIEYYDVLEKKEMKSATKNEFLQHLKDSAAAAKEFNAGMVTLQEKGLDTRFLEDLEKEGTASLYKIQALLQMTPEEFSKAQQYIAEAGNEALTSAERQLQDEKAKIDKELQSIDVILQSTADMAYEESQAIGTQIGNGILAGIDVMIPLLNAKVAELAAGMKSAALAALSIASPSRWFKEHVGKNIPAGIAVGIADEMPRTIDVFEKQLNRLKLVADASKLDIGSSAHELIGANASGGAFGVMANKLEHMARRENKVEVDLKIKESNDRRGFASYLNFEINKVKKLEGERVRA
jgi:hypothetical protein